MSRGYSVAEFDMKWRHWQDDGIAVFRGDLLMVIEGLLYSRVIYSW
jgi:hypothetical protein